MKTILSETRVESYDFIYDIDENDFIKWCKENNIEEIDSVIIQEYIDLKEINFVKEMLIDSYIDSSEFDGDDIDILNDLLDEAD